MMAGIQLGCVMDAGGEGVEKVERQRGLSMGCIDTYKDRLIS